jgi:hypothetical protein
MITGTATGALTGAGDAPAETYRANREAFKQNPVLFGFDAVVIHGQSTKPTILAIYPEGVGFHEAGEIWGMETYGAEEAVRERFSRSGFGKRGVVVIGPAGERCVRFAVIESW